MTFELRDYQFSIINKTRASMAMGLKRILVQASCGAGKTIIACEIARLATAKGSKILFLVHRRDLVKQTVDKFQQYGLGDLVGVILAGEESDHSKPIQIGSVQTYSRRLNLDQIDRNPWFHEAHIVIADEVHVFGAPTYKAVLDHHKDAYLIGLSATPYRRGAGFGLGNLFDEMIQCVPMAELIKGGHLVPPVHFSGSEPDLKGIGIVAGEYNQKELGERVDTPKLVGDIYQNFARICPERKCLVFATNVKHSQHIKLTFERNGVKAEHIDSHTDDEERLRIYDGFQNGDIQVITNCNIATEGSDLPAASAIIIAKPVLSPARWRQMAGRGARPFPGKTNYYLLVHSGAIAIHGLADDDYNWTLDNKIVIANKQKPKEKVQRIITCPECSHVFKSAQRCPLCMTWMQTFGKKIETLDAELVEVGKAKKPKPTMQEKQQFYSMLEHYRRQKNYQRGWTSHQFRQRHGVWPKGLNETPIEPDQAFLNYMKYQAIRKAKQREKEQKQVLTGLPT